MSRQQPFEYDLYLDESGSFRETASKMAKARSGKRSARFPSQLAGLVVERRSLTEEAATEALYAAHAAAGWNLGAEVHGKNLQPGDSYNLMIEELLHQCRDRCWQPVRLVNKERVHYGDKAAAYTNLVAELLLRICQRKQQKGQRRITIRLICARMDVREEGGSSVLLEVDEYRDRIAEYFAFTAVRHGLARESADWRVEGPRLGSGTRWRELQICDLISNATHDRFTKCRHGKKRCDAATALKQALGPYDFSLAISELLDRVDDLINQNALAFALILLAERLSEADGGGEIRDGARNA